MTAATTTRRASRATSDYAELMGLIKDAGLLKKTPGFYLSKMAVVGALLAGSITVFVLLGDSWFQLVVAGVLGVLLTQAAFIGHEAAHKQVFTSNKVNDWTGLIIGNLVVGLSYGWWTSKHNRHHGNPNKIGKDPDIYDPVVAFTPEQAQQRTGLFKAFTTRQGYLFFPLLFLEGLNLHRDAVATALRKPGLKRRWLEISFLVIRLILVPAAIFWYLPIGLAFAFLGVQLGILGFYMGASFAPNHKGMPQLDDRTTLNFLHRQVLTSRNITGNGFNTYLMGGLNFQIEHHLFPSMPRPHLKKAQAIVKNFCATRGIRYTEVPLLRSYGIVIEYLNRVGIGSRDPFECPLGGAARAM